MFRIPPVVQKFRFLRPVFHCIFKQYLKSINVLHRDGFSLSNKTVQ